METFFFINIFIKIYTDNNILIYYNTNTITYVGKTIYQDKNLSQ
jgi:hypothetical protein